eukprot:TRINITY_DN48182_c0_g1_i1.p1 TRINITY_DN48182_c0_g1~~TRINITY_DN48182_c0_g1_i1.p1  ORF type:complete len:356 (+),score=82.48 TRINITY_DN48182_c0_g1_i1:83-1150(+)
MTYKVLFGLGFAATQCEAFYPVYHPNDVMPERQQITRPQLKALYVKMDTDRDGKVSQKEIVSFAESVVQSRLADHVFHFFKRLQEEDPADMYLEEPDKVSLQELLGHPVPLYGTDAEAGFSYHQAQAAKFAAADSNQDGFLNAKELPSYFHTEINPGVHKVEGETYIKQWDLNKDGTLDIHEYFGDGPSQIAEGILALTADAKKEGEATTTAPTPEEGPEESPEEIPKETPEETPEETPKEPEDGVNPPVPTPEEPLMEPSVGRTAKEQRREFDILDKNGDGKLQPDEVQNIENGKHEFEHILARAAAHGDTDGDGLLTLKELQKGMYAEDEAGRDLAMYLMTFHEHSEGKHSEL